MVDMLLMVEKWIGGNLCQYVNKPAEANNKYLKDYDKYEKSSYLKYRDLNNLYGWEILQKLPVTRFMWVEDFTEFFICVFIFMWVEDFMKSCYEKSYEGYFFEAYI